MNLPNDKVRRKLEQNKKVQQTNAHFLLLQIKLYWNTATTIQLLIIYGNFLIPMANLSRENTTYP